MPIVVKMLKLNLKTIIHRFLCRDTFSNRPPYSLAHISPGSHWCSPSRRFHTRGQWSWDSHIWGAALGKSTKRDITQHLTYQEKTALDWILNKPACFSAIVTSMPQTMHCLYSLTWDGGGLLCSPAGAPPLAGHVVPRDTFGETGILVFFPIGPTHGIQQHPDAVTLGT